MRIARLTLAMIMLAACGDGGTEPEPDPIALPTAMSIVAGDAQEDTVTDLLPEPLTVAVTDTTGTGAFAIMRVASGMQLVGDPVPGALVNYVVVDEDCGRPWAGSALTDSMGVAADLWELGTRAGSCRMEVRAVTSAGVPMVFDTFVATAIAGPATALESLVPSFAWLGDSLRADDAAHATDAYGNVVAFAVAPGAGVQAEGAWLHYVGDEGWRSITITAGDIAATDSTLALRDLRGEWTSSLLCLDGRDRYREADSVRVVRDSVVASAISESVTYYHATADSTILNMRFGGGAHYEYWADGVVDTLPHGENLDLEQRPGELYQINGGSTWTIASAAPLTYELSTIAANCLAGVERRLVRAGEP